MAKEKNIKKEMELRNLAEMLVRNPEATAIVANIFIENAKYGGRRVSEVSHKMIAEVSEYEEKDIPIEVLKFLKKTKNIHVFFEIVRKVIINRLLSEHLLDKQIRKYVGFFNSKSLKECIETSRTNKTLKKFVIMVCLDDAGIFYDTNPAYYMKLVKKLYRLDWNDRSVIQALNRLCSQKN